MSDERVPIFADAIRRAAGRGSNGTEIAEAFLADALVQPYLTDEYKEENDAAINFGMGQAEGEAKVRAEYQEFYNFVADNDPALVDAWHFQENNKPGGLAEQVRNALPDGWKPPRAKLGEPAYDRPDIPRKEDL